MGITTEYSNPLAWILLKRPSLRQQFIVPPLPPKPLENFLLWYERIILNVDIQHIQIDRPIFLIGLHRSGTSMLQDILCTHPNLAYITNTMAAAPRCFCGIEDIRKRLNLNLRMERYLSDSIEVENGSPNEGVAFWQTLLKEDPYSWNYVERRIEHFYPNELEEIRKTLRKIIWCFRYEANRFFNKNPRLLPYLLLLKDIFPDAKFVHIVRDARMCANSMIKFYQLTQDQLARIKASGRHGIYDDHPFIPYPSLPKLANYLEMYGPDDIRTTAHLWNDGISLVNKYRDKLPYFYEIRYEDILIKPQEVVFKILEFCELPKPERNNEKFWRKISQVGKIHHTNRYGDFGVVEEICWDNLQKYGYI